MANQNIEQIKKHLEFLGYTIKQLDETNPDENAVLADHPIKPNIFFRQYSGGALAVYSFKTGQAAKDQRSEFLDFINSVNAKTTVARCFANSEGSFVFEAWYSGDYDKKMFGLFMDYLDRDTDKWRQAETGQKFFG